jgi:hypothetical protein
MTQAHENNIVASNEVAASREWLRPTVQRLEAGSAEDDSGPSTDAIINPS